ncbi:hypothetical protein [Archangium sp.]|uniref:hypothetical protein n=1 Tax=Archangium sp. TaxID=1872627 RepID=UPI002D682C06|nr:hypothetical protein [Archangium sp.]HYO58604.1 hypothetical protein [Archangium sp.]
MRKTGMKLALLGGFAGAALLAGCNHYDEPFKDNPYDFGRLWSLTAQEDYYSEQAQDEAGRGHSNIGTSATLFETNEQERGMGGAGEADANVRNNDLPRIQGNKQAQPNLWLQQDMRVPYPPPQLDSVVAMDLGTGKPLRAGPNGAWVQGTHAIELGSGLATSLSSTSSSWQPQEPPEGNQSLPNSPSGEGQQAPKGQKGQPPAADDQ